MIHWLQTNSNSKTRGGPPFPPVRGLLSGRPVVSTAKCLALAALLTGVWPVSAQDQPSKTNFFLPKSPVAAAYMLGRLSSKELTEAPRSEFVYAALLARAGLDRKYRMEALHGLAEARHTDELTQLIRGLDELDGKGDDARPVIQELASILLQFKPAELSAKRTDLAKLADEGQQALTRQAGYASILSADGGPGTIWERVESDSAKLTDLILSIPLIREAPLRAALYSKVEPLLHKADPVEPHLAAIQTIGAIPGHDTETFLALAPFVKSETERVAAVAGIQRLPRKSWDKEQAEPLVATLTTWLQGVPVEQRTEPDAISAFRLATDLAAMLPPDRAKLAARSLRALGVSVFVIRTIREQMLYDRTLIVVEAGKPVQITLVNEDSMPHNIAVVAPGSLEEVGQAAEKMPPEPDAEGRLYVPNSPKVLQATKMAEPGRQITLSFTAPTEPGEYQYVCTFPGHWRRMTGTLAVVKDIDAYLAAHAASAAPKLTEWKIDDFKADLAGAAAGRNLDEGKELFTKLGCAQCHKIGGQGANYGPDLTGIFHHYNNDRTIVLRQILEPSIVISNRFVNYEFEQNDGESVFGLIVKEDASTITIQTGPADNLVQTIRKSTIKERHAQPSSVMPLGLLNTISKEQILNLLAYLEAGGNTGPPAPEHHH